MKKLIISLLFGLFIFPTVVFGESSTTTSETEDTKEKQTVEIVTTVSNPLSTKLKVGEETKLTLGKFIGVVPKGEFKEVKTDFIQLDKTGKIKALKVGTTKVTPTFTLSTDSLNEIKKAYLEQNKNLKEEDINFVVKQNEKEMTYEIKEKEKEELIVDTTLSYIVSPTELVVGQTGKVTPKPILGVELAGSFETDKNASIDLKKDGKFVALKAGKFEVKPVFKMSKETEVAIKKAALKKANDKTLTEDNVVFVNKDILYTYPIIIKEATPKKEKVEIELTFSSSPSTLSVGQQGKTIVNSIYGVRPEGTFKPFENEAINIRTDGTFKVLKPGKVSILPNFMISEESKKEVTRAYLKQSKDKTLTEDNLELVFKGSKTLVSIEVVASSTSVNNNNNSNSKGMTKTLPKTGEKQASIWLGFVAILLSVGLFYKKLN